MTVLISKPAFNLRETLNSLRRKMGIKGAELLRANTSDDVYEVIGRNRNLLINGDFRVSQRGVFTSPASVNVEYRLDRWKNIYVSGTHTFVHNLDQQINANINGYTRTLTANTLRFDTSAAGLFAMSQNIEDFKSARGRQVILSLLYKCNADSAINIYDGATQTHYKLPNTSGAWAWISSAPFQVSASATELRVELYTYPNTPQAGSYTELTQVQLEFGSVATPFEYRPYATELALCQRYFCKSFPTDVAPANATTIADSRSLVPYSSTYSYTDTIHFPVAMRAAPTMTAYSSEAGTGNNWQYFNGSGWYNASSTPFYAIKTNGFRAEPVGSFTPWVPNLCQGHWTASAEL